MALRICFICSETVLDYDRTDTCIIQMHMCTGITRGRVLKGELYVKEFRSKQINI